MHENINTVHRGLSEDTSPLVLVIVVYFVYMTETRRSFIQISKESAENNWITGEGVATGGDQLECRSRSRPFARQQHHSPAMIVQSKFTVIPLHSAHRSTGFSPSNSGHLLQVNWHLLREDRPSLMQIFRRQTTAHNCLVCIHIKRSLISIVSSLLIFNVICIFKIIPIYRTASQIYQSWFRTRNLFKIFAAIDDFPDNNATKKKYPITQNYIVSWK